jgi:uncharacterized membrane-anchored protein
MKPLFGGFLVSVLYNRSSAVFLLVGIAHVCKKTDRMLKVRLESDLSAKILAK